MKRIVNRIKTLLNKEDELSVELNKKHKKTEIEEIKSALKEIELRDR